MRFTPSRKALVPSVYSFVVILTVSEVFLRITTIINIIIYLKIVMIMTVVMMTVQIMIMMMMTIMTRIVVMIVLIAVIIMVILMMNNMMTVNMVMVIMIEKMVLSMLTMIMISLIIMVKIITTIIIISWSRTSMLLFFHLNVFQKNCVQNSSCANKLFRFQSTPGGIVSPFDKTFTTLFSYSDFSHGCGSERSEYGNLAIWFVRKQSDISLISFSGGI